MPEFTLEDYKDSWKRVKKRTSSHGPAHFGHYKAGCTNDEIARLHHPSARFEIASSISFLSVGAAASPPLRFKDIEFYGLVPG